MSEDTQAQVDQAEAADERPLPTTVEEWLEDPRGPIPRGNPVLVDRGLMTPWEALRMAWRQIRERRLVLDDYDNSRRSE